MGSPFLEQPISHIKSGNQVVRIGVQGNEFDLSPVGNPAAIRHRKGFPQRDVKHPVVDVAGDCALERCNAQPAQAHLKQRAPDDQPLLSCIVAGQ